MRRKDLKLRLDRETLVDLERGVLDEVAGGATLRCSDLTSCVGCNTRNTCTTRYC